GGETASANLFIGSKELNLGSAFNTWNQVQVDDADLDGVEVNMSGNMTELSQMQFRVDATQIANEDLDEDYDWLAMGDTFKDPMFGFEVSFVEAVPGFMASSRDYVELKSSGDDFVVSFTNNDDVEYEFSPYSYVGSNMTAGEDWVASGTAVAKNEMFISYEDYTGNEPVSRIFKFTGTTDSDTKANFKDIGSGETYTVSNTSQLAKTGVSVTTGDDTVTLSSAVNNSIFTKSGMMITFPAENEAGNSSNSILIAFDEDNKAQNANEVQGASYTAALSWDDTDDEFDIARPGSGFAEDQSDDNDWYYGVSNYGTYYKQEADESTSLELWIPPEDVTYSVYLAGPDSVVSTVGGSDDSTYYNVNPIGVGIGVLDTNAPALGSAPMIVVGGPCANTVAAELMGNPENCVEGFEEGKAVIRFYEDSEAILVAGYSALDTQGASRVLANYAEWGLTGTEVEVVVPTLSGISVNPLA
ncbi:MAG: hypothetical protein KKF65_00245, partial [Nanoarchaeota archaeon]|nr:hypothetical protein [Nanoarchaeota archaeon]